MFVRCESVVLQRGQAPLPDLFYSQLRKRRMELESENETSQEVGLPPLVEKGISNTLIPHNVAEHIVDKLSSTLIESKY